MHIEDVVDRYFECIRAQDIDSLTTLYADDATFVLPTGNHFSGVSSIREMHLAVFQTGAPCPTPLAVVLGDTAAAVEIETRLSDGTNRRTANFFQCDAAGLIKRICVYMQMTP